MYYLTLVFRKTSLLLTAIFIGLALAAFVGSFAIESLPLAAVSLCTAIVLLFCATLTFARRGSRAFDELRALRIAEANPDTIDAEGNSALHLAAKRDQVEVARFLLSRGAALELRNDAYETPLFVAVKGGSLATVELLLSNGADPNACDAEGEPILKTAISWAYFSSPPMAITEALIRGGADIKATFGASSPLGYVAEYSSHEFAALLIASGADVNARDKFDRTPLHVAAEHGKFRIVKALQAAGADADAIDGLGRTALEIAKIPPVIAVLREARSCST